MRHLFQEAIRRAVAHRILRQRTHRLSPYFLEKIQLPEMFLI
jgi:hypothetical protein